MYYYYYYSSCSLNRSSHWRFSVKKVFLKISQILQKTPVSESLFKTRIHCRCLPVKFGKFLRASIFRNICKRLILIKVGLTFLNFNLSKVLQLLAFLVSWVSEVYLNPTKVLWWGTFAKMLPNNGDKASEAVLHFFLMR